MAPMIQIHFEDDALIQMVTKYSSLVTRSPLTVIILTFGISFGLTALAIFLNYHVIDFDPEKGFETRGTKRSSERMTIDEVKNIQASGEHMVRWYFQNATRRFNRDTGNESSLITVNYDDYGVDSEPTINDITKDHCEMFGSIGKQVPYDIIELLAKVMIKVSSVDQLFSMESMITMCKIDFIINDVAKETNFTNTMDLINHSFNLATMTTCVNISTKNECEAINQNDVDYFRNLIFQCQTEARDSRCDAFSINLANNLLLPRDFNENSTNFLISVILKIPKWSGQNLDFYEKLHQRLSQELPNGFKLVGVSFNTKLESFSDAILMDIMISSISAALVLCWFFIYSKSLWFTFIVVFIIVLSTGSAFFVYTVILNIKFFPFINLLVIVLLISIGADDAFVLLVYHRSQLERMSKLEYKVGTQYVPLYRDNDLIIHCLRRSLRHSLLSMLITSLTTAATFLTNLTSSVIVLRCFGVFASITVLLNYILVIFILPSAIIITQKDIIPQSFVKSVSEYVTDITKRLRFLLLFCAILCTITSVWYVLKPPGLSIPDKNPTKIFVDSNPHEFFDNNAHNFNYEWKRSVKFIKYYLFGLKPMNDFPSLDPNLKPIQETMTQFYLSDQLLEQFQGIYEKQASKFFNISEYPSWSHLFRIRNETCSGNMPIDSECIIKISVKYNQLINQFPNDYAVIPSDGPLIDKQLNIIGYFIAIPTNEKLRTDGEPIRLTFDQIENDCKSIEYDYPLVFRENRLICTSSSMVTKFYDIVDQLKSTTLFSVAISLSICLVVIIIVTRSIQLSMVCSFVIFSVISWTIAVLIILGWQLSVIESTILIITIGLSFDYTLHYAVAVKDGKNGDKMENIKIAHCTAGVASTLAAITLISAGLPLLACQTSSFYQTGTMLIVLGVTSIIGSTLVFPALILFTVY